MKQKTFFRGHLTVAYSRRSLIGGGVTAILLLALVLATGKLFFAEVHAAQIILYICCLLSAPLIGGLIAAYSITLQPTTLQNCVNTLLLFLSPIVIITMSEALNGIFVYDMTYFGFAANYLLIMLCGGFIFALSGSYRLPLWILSPLIFVMGIVNRFMMQFRGTPFVPMDFLSLSVADTILREYTYRIDYQMICAFLLLVFLLTVGTRLRTPVFRKPTKILSRILSGAICVTVMLLFFLTSVFAGIGVAPDFWNQARGYRNYGFFYSFFINTRYMYVLKPAGYDPDAIEKYVTARLEDDEPPQETNVQPDILCIMNESLADLSVLGTVNTNADPLPFISSLRENTVRGTLYVPVIGAGTANTEFEFLTGHSMAFLPSGSNAFILYAKRPLPNLATTLAAQNYAVSALHPYYRRGWNRDTVYPLLGLHRFFSLEDLLPMAPFEEYQRTGDMEYLQERMAEAYPDINILMRQYVRDDYNYRLLIEDYEQRDQSKPYFMFNVTMQNHGGYRLDATNFEQPIRLTDTDVYPAVNRYLSLLRHSDDAFRELVEYFSTVDRPVIICLFGDHQPSIEESFVEETLGTPIDSLTIEQQQARHTTPFLIWANYDIEEREIQALSSNYLSSLLLETAGLPMSTYNRYLLSLSKTLPVIDTVGYIDCTGTHYAWSDSSPYDDLLEEYRMIQYNGLLDTDNRHSALFTGPETKAP